VVAIDPLGAVVAGQTVVVVLLALIVVGLLRSHAVVLRQLEELGAGVGDPSADRQQRPIRTVDGVPEPRSESGVVADIEGADLSSGAVVLRVAGVGHRTLLVFLSSGCLTCRRFWDAIGDPRSMGLPDGVRLVVVAKDAAEESMTALSDLAPPDVPLVLSSTAWADYNVPGSPYVVLVDGPDGRVLGEGTGLDWPQVAALLAQATDDMRFVGAQARGKRGAGGREREAMVDTELRAAGIEADHPSLYPSASAPRPDA
jgi:hypothetical protein